MAIAYPLAWPVRGDGSPMAPTTISLALAALSKTGGQAANGQEQVVASPAARWEGRVDLPALAASDIVPFRGFLAAMQGRVGTVLLPAFEAGRQPWPVDAQGHVLHPGRARSARLAGTIFAVDPAKDAEADIVASVAAAPVNATNLTLTIRQGGIIRAGHRFSLGSRLHEILSARCRTGSGGGRCSSPSRS